MAKANKEGFIIGGDGHAGLTARKAAKILGLNYHTVALLIKIGKVFTDREENDILFAGFQGDNLCKLATFYARSEQCSVETRNKCIDMLNKASKKGMQAIIDELAGVNDLSDLSKSILEPVPTVALDQQIQELSERIAALEEQAQQDTVYQHKYNLNVTENKRAKMSQKNNFKRHLKQWIEQELHFYSMNLQDFAQVLSVNAGVKVSTEMLRAWKEGELKQLPSQRGLKAIAAWRDEPVNQTVSWLVHGK